MARWTREQILGASASLQHDARLAFQKYRSWHLLFCFHTNCQRCCCSCLDWGRRNLAQWLFFPLASPSSLGYRSANSCKESRDH